MILQCDQCQTKFRLDDSKMKPGGVKVRCSKCRHVFVAGAEPKQEESDFDAILSGLGAPAPEQKAPAAPQEPAGFDFTPVPPQEEPTKEAPSAGAAPAAEPAAESTEEPSFSEADFPDFSAFEFAAEPAQQAQQPVTEKPAASQEQVDFGAFEFAPEEEPPRQEEQPSAPSGGLDYGELSFMEEPAAAPKEEPAAPAPAGEFDFGDFSFAEEPTVTPEQEEPAEAGGGLEFGEFEFSTEPVTKPQEPSTEHELDFGEFTFNEEPAAGGEPAEEKDAFDFSDFSFAEEPPPLKETAPHEVSEDLGAFSFGEEPETKPAEAAPSAPADLFTLGEFSFEEEKETTPAEFAAPSAPAEPAPSAEIPKRREEGAAAKGAEGEPAGEAEHGLGIAAGIAAGVAAGAAAAAASKKGPAPVPPISPAPGQQKETPKETPLDFAFGPKPVMGTVAEAEEEELPPLSISSRRKGRSMFTVAVLAVCVLLIVALAGAGLYLTQSGPAAFEKFNKAGLGFIPKWFGMEAPEEGKITVKNPLASFSQNKEAGELFVVTGEAVNSYSKARASIRVKVSIFDKKGAVVAQKTAYCGNRLTKEQLETLPMSKIDAIMNNQFGDSLSNLGVKPGQSIPFVVAIPNVPKDAADFGVEPAGSTVAGDTK